MQSFKSCLLILFILPQVGFSKNIGMSLGAFVNSSSVLRGAQTWSKPSFMAGPSFTLFNKVSVRGPSLQYSHFNRESPFELGAGVSLIDDDEPLLALSGQDEDYRNQRESTWELQLNFKYKFGFFNKFFIGAMVGKDIDETKGLYSELQLGVPGLLKYTSFEYKISFAESAVNRYYYGPRAISGRGWQEISFKYVMLPSAGIVPWNGVVINTLAYSKVLQNQNKSADYIRLRDTNLVFSSVFIWNLF
ncbi:MAG: hypothetical protein CME70_12680 [Halobacteriovorax sp.]|nr:hypothetical protein [Halobacteriovorax sp.]|tara:strand:- start:198148 stop:198888 length:741 start_codon:yes stop_codon:yes gene_type:complete